MATVVMSAPPAGAFPVTFGSSFSDLQEPTHWSLRYDFKPASVSSAASGKIRMGNDNQVCLDLLNKQSGQGDLSFNGHSERYDGLDCVAIFDGQTWRLEMLAGSVKVRHVKSQHRAASGRSATSPAPAALDQPIPMDIARPAHQLPAQPLETMYTQAERQSSQAREESSQEPSDQQRSTADIIAVCPSTSSDTSTDGGAASGEEEGQCSAAPPHSNSMSPSPRAVVPSPVHRHQQVPNGYHAAQQNGHAVPPSMTDLERQFFATQSPSSESSESSETDESDDGSEDNENDGFEHF